MLCEVGGTLVLGMLFTRWFFLFFCFFWRGFFGFGFGGGKGNGKRKGKGKRKEKKGKKKTLTIDGL